PFRAGRAGNRECGRVGLLLADGLSQLAANCTFVLAHPKRHVRTIDRDSNRKSLDPRVFELLDNRVVSIETGRPQSDIINTKGFQGIQLAELLTHVPVGPSHRYLSYLNTTTLGFVLNPVRDALPEFILQMHQRDADTERLLCFEIGRA